MPFSVRARLLIALSLADPLCTQARTERRRARQPVERALYFQIKDKVIGEAKNSFFVVCVPTL